MKSLLTTLLLLSSFIVSAQDKIFAGLYYGDKHNHQMVQVVPLSEYSYYYNQKTTLFYQVLPDVYLVLNEVGRETLKEILKDSPRSERKQYKKFTKELGNHFFYKNWIKVNNDLLKKSTKEKKILNRNCKEKEYLRVVYF